MIHTRDPTAQAGDYEDPHTHRNVHMDFMMTAAAVPRASENLAFLIRSVAHNLLTTDVPVQSVYRSASINGVGAAAHYVHLSS